MWNEKEGYIKPKEYNDMFCIPNYIESSILISIQILDKKFIDSNHGLIIRRNNGTKIKL